MWLLKNLWESEQDAMASHHIDQQTLVRIMADNGMSVEDINEFELRLYNLYVSVSGEILHPVTQRMLSIVARRVTVGRHLSPVSRQRVDTLTAPQQ